MPSGSSGRLDPASAPAPSGETSARRSASSESLEVAGERPEVREQVVREQHRLGALEVRVPREVDVGAGLRGALEQDPLEIDAAPSATAAPFART